MVSFWGEIPYSRYQFMNVISEAGGGLEHKDCTLMLTSRWSWKDEDRRRGWYGLVSHELFHAWNGKRLRPVALGPFDYEKEVLTPDLWMVEGFTSYYDDLIVARAGLMNSDQYLKRLSDQIESIRNSPGRQVRPLSEASTDAWIRYYQQDENAINSQISYYTKELSSPGSSTAPFVKPPSTSAASTMPCAWPSSDTREKRVTLRNNYERSSKRSPANPSPTSLRDTSTEPTIWTMQSF